VFFFEKKNQKTSIQKSGHSGRLQTFELDSQLTKFFCFFLFTKRRFFLHFYLLILLPILLD